MKHLFILLTAGAVGGFTVAAQAATSNAAQFNPAMSVVIQGNAYFDNRDNEGAGYLEHSSAIAPAGEVEAEQRAFNLHGTELAFSSNVDSYFKLWVAATIEGEELELEEAWLQTHALPYGLQVKAGRLLSQIGYHNGKHAHSWAFMDQNLAYTALFHSEHLSGDGMQLTWLAPTDSYLLLGTELLQGDELNGFGGSPDADELADELGLTDPDDLALSDPRGPNLATAFVHFAPDLGSRQALQLGVSAAWHQQHLHQFDLNGDTLITQGDAYLYGVQAIYKRFARDSYGTHGLTLTGEFFTANSRNRGSVFDNTGIIGNSTGEWRQNAGYVQALYGFAPRWQVGLRHAVAGTDSHYRAGSTTTDLHSSRQSSALLTWNLTEFSRLRLQVSDSRLWLDNTGPKSLNQIMLGYTMIIGAHPAHQF